jgi:hypothetical protein
MAEWASFFETNVEAAGLARGNVVDSSGASIIVVCDGDDSPIECEMLLTSARDCLVLAKGDAVLVWRSSSRSTTGVVLGRLGISVVRPDLSTEHTREGRQDSAVVGDVVPETVVLEAKESLTLRVGDGSITIRADGKILIKGKDLVSHAKNVNRIKGGAVAIN